MRQSGKSIALVSAALLGVALTTIPAVAGDCNIEKVVKEWTARKTALSDIRKALVKLTSALQNDPDYVDTQFGGSGPKQGFSKSVAARQAEFSIAVLQFGGNCVLKSGSNVPVCTPTNPPTTCYACPIKDAYQLAIAAGAKCTELIRRVQDRPGFGGQTFNCEKVKDVSRMDLAYVQQLGVDYWTEIKDIQGPGTGLNVESVLQEPVTSGTDEVLKFLLRSLEIRLKVFVDIHKNTPDPNPTQLATDINTTPCIGYADYIAGKEPW